MAEVTHSPSPRVLVTGGTGFLGHTLVPALAAAGVSVRLMVRRPTNVPEAFQQAAEEVVPGDVLDLPSLEAALQGCSGVVHAAGVVSFWRRGRRHMLRVNEQGTANLVDVLMAGTHGFPVEQTRLVHIGSTAALGRTKPSTGPDHLIGPSHRFQATRYDSYYALTKYRADKQVFRGIAEGLSAAILSPSVIIGAGPPDRSSGAMLAAARKSRRYYPIGGNGFVAAHDVAQAACRLLQSDDFPSGQRFLLNGENLSYEAFFRLVAEREGFPAPKHGMPSSWVRLGGRAFGLLHRLTGLKGPLSPETARNLNHTWRYDGSSGQSLLGQPYTPISETLRHLTPAFK